MKLVPR